MEKPLFRDAGGMYALAFCGAGTSLWALSAWILTVSLGQHILMGMIDTIVIHTARPENRSLRLGQMKALGTAAALLGALCVWIKWKFNQSFAVDFFVTGGVCLLAFLFLSRVKTPVFPQRRGWRQCFVFKHRYAVYYGLEILHGIRKQLYLTFGFWLMVSTLGQPPGYIGKTLLIAGVIGLATQPLIGWSIKRYGERKVTIFDSIALSLLCLAYAFAPELLPLHWAVGVVTACFVLDNLLFALGMARSTYVARICEKPEDITPSIYTGLAINHVASITYGVLGGVIWMNTGGPQAVFLIGGLATAGAGLVARHMDEQGRNGA
ncbi:MFS transporter [Akkermansia sp.]|uniref:MFS transporter n=1 Tax=Akkermansia sp. TaxID=1872421 RepID=UPI003AEFF389